MAPCVICSPRTPEASPRPAPYTVAEIHPRVEDPWASLLPVNFTLAAPQGSQKMSFCVICPPRGAQEGPLVHSRSNQAAVESFRNEPTVGGGTRPVRQSLGA